MLVCPSSCACFFFFFNDTATTEIYTLSLHDALPIWVVVAHRLLTSQRDLPGRTRHQSGHELPEVVFDALLVLRGRWHDLRQQDDPAPVDSVAGIKEAARRRGGARAPPGAAGHLDARRRGGLVFGDHAQRLM